jgi:hypothetical protein
VKKFSIGQMKVNNKVFVKNNILIDLNFIIQNFALFKGVGNHFRDQGFLEYLKIWKRNLYFLGQIGQNQYGPGRGGIQTRSKGFLVKK